MESSSPVLFKPHFWPRGLGDFVITMFVALPIQFTVLFIIPGLAVAFAFESVDLGFLTAGLVYVVFLLFSVSSISLANDGIRFKRVLGGPKHLPWNEVIEVSEVGRWELVTKGWLWPIFPAREMTACLSSLHHFKIYWRGGSCYFPPSNIEAFQDKVNSHLSSREAQRFAGTSK